MELYQLRYFYYAAQYENLSEASRQLMVAQSSISKAIAGLETELHTKLFTRSGKKITLNSNGMLLRSRVAPILSAVDALPSCFQNSEGLPTIRLRVLCASALIPDILARFRDIAPEVRFQLLQSDSREDVDLTILASPNELVGYGATLLTREEILLAVPSSSPLSLYREVRLEQLEQEPMIMLLGDRLLRDQVEHMFRAMGRKLNVSFESDNPFLVRMLVQHGLGITLWPSRTWSAYSTENLAFLSLVEPQAYRNVYMVTRHPDRELSPALVQFMNYLRRYFKTVLT